MKHSTSRALAAAAAGVALLAPTAAGHAAEAAPKAQTKQLVKDVAGKDKRLARLATSTKVTRLADENEQVLVANITEDRADLAELKTAAEAADSTYDAKAVRKDLRSFRVENYVLAANIVKQAEALADEAAADPEAAAAVDAAIDAALALTADSTKADVKAARVHLQTAHEELDAEETTTTPAPTA
ncbi:hypothetical protein DDE18_09760 [Nocardioides gansuensis]|uniref:Uncharacterized protein n=1 Tax=Nocardioides gansuensis TaxID=2138300 RepID=A0A2T8FA85_9ACTN|nr:hypothetical protein [Nocardioides gansuensis]PVG82651.1 hypothetical protein DDE18_09760 [Nocardioides gansuensis]